MEERRKAKTGVEPVGIRATELIRTLSMSSDDAPLVECVKRHEMRPPSGETARSLDDHLGAPPSLPNLDSFFTYTTPCVPMRRDGTSKVRISFPAPTLSTAVQRGTCEDTRTSCGYAATHFTPLPSRAALVSRYPETRH